MYPLYDSVVRKQEEVAVFLIAKPLRALSDYVYASRKEWSANQLEGSLRIEIMPFNLTMFC